MLVFHKKISTHKWHKKHLKSEWLPKISEQWENTRVLLLVLSVTMRMNWRTKRSLRTTRSMLRLSTNSWTGRDSPRR